MDSYEREGLRTRLILLQSKLKRSGHLDVQLNRTVRGQNAIPHTQCPYPERERQQFESMQQWGALRKRLKEARSGRCENCDGW